MQTTPRFPGLPRITDGIGSVVWVETHASDGAAAYPITPSTEMGVQYEQAVANGVRNLWGRPLTFLELESEHSSASACEGFALAGGRAANFTSGQGLILMKEVLYVISGKRLPVVFHIGARALTSQALNVHAGHDDVFGVADTGWGMLFAKNAQEAADFAVIARRAAEETHTPFFNVQDGFLTTHTVQNVLLPEPELIEEFLGDPGEKLRCLFDTADPRMTGVVENQDAYMKGKVAQRAYYARLAPALREAMAEWESLTGRAYGLVERYRMDDAELAVVALGSMAETAMATADALRRQGKKVGVLNVRTLRPFPGAEIAAALSGVRAAAVVERLDVPSMQSNPLAAEVKSALFDAVQGVPGYRPIPKVPRILQGVAGLGSRDVRPGDFAAVFAELARAEAPTKSFVLGVDHADALPRLPDPDTLAPGSLSMRMHAIGGFGAVTTNKVLANVAGDVFDRFVQAYPRYGSEKKGLPTAAFLVISPEPIRTHCELERVDVVAVLDAAALRSASTFAGLVCGGTLLLSGPADMPLPPAAIRAIREKDLRVFTCDLRAIAEALAPRKDLVARMQGIVLLGAFFEITPLAAGAGLSAEDLEAGIERALGKYFGKLGAAVLRANLEAVKRGRVEVRRLSTEGLPVPGPSLEVVT